jgi:hypothetical protein
MGLKLLMSYNFNKFNTHWPCNLFLAWTIFLSQLFVFKAWAASEEIQVYTDDKEAPGHVSVDWHNNYVISGRSNSDYLGEQAPNHVYRLTPEFNLGLTDTLELGVYLLSTRSPQGDWNGDGYKVRLKYISPHYEQGMYWGLNLEVGQQAQPVAQYPRNAQLKAILGWNLGKWNVAMNLNSDGSFNSGSGPITEDFDFKINYAVGEKTQLGIESYNELGPGNHFSGFNSESKIIYAVVDTEILGHELNAGIGRGLNNQSDQWVVKFIVNTPF